MMEFHLSEVCAAAVEGGVKVWLEASPDEVINHSEPAHVTILSFGLFINAFSLVVVLQEKMVSLRRRTCLNIL